MKLVVALVAVLLLAAPVAAQTCTPTYIHGVANAFSGSGGFALGQTVPAGQVWQIESAGIGTDDSAFPYPIDFSFGVADSEALYPVELSRAIVGNTPGGVAAASFHGGTPMMAVSRRLIIPAGMKLYGRENGLPAFHNWYISYYGFSVPMACLERLMLGGGTVTQTSAAPPPPDLSALVQAAAAAAAKLTESATALTTLSQSTP